MKEAWGAAHHGPPGATGVEKASNEIGMSSKPLLRPLTAVLGPCSPLDADSYPKADVQDMPRLSPGQQLGINTLVTPMKAFMDTPQIAEKIKNGVSTFMEAVPPLVRALDEVAKIHPFIAGANLSSWGHIVLLTIYHA